MSELELVSVKNQILLPRSGHKLVVDDKYLYVLGGYVERNTLVNNHEVTGEIWRYHLVYKTWEKCVFDNELFKLGASHSAVRIGECVFITGGTGLPFGTNILDSLIVVNLKRMTQKMFQFHPKNNLNKNLPIATYGHTMTFVYMNKTPYLFIIGGTTGDSYHQEVYQVNLITLESELVSDSQMKDAPKPRYKHEAFLYEDHIYVFGGATVSEFCHSFDVIHKFNIHTRTWTVSKTKVPISVALRCPSMTQNGKYVYVSGGYPDTDFISETIYQLDLSDLSWSLIGSWSTPSYFHDSVFVPQLGAVFLFGGVNRITPSQKRHNNLFMLRPPTARVTRSLTELAWQVVLESNIVALETLAGHGDTEIGNYLLNLGVPAAMVARATISDGGDSHAA